MTEETTNTASSEEKQALIKQMLEMQKKFIEYEHTHEGVAQADYYTPEPGHPLENYQEEYTRLANRLVDLAHEEKGSKR